MGTASMLCFWFDFLFMRFVWFPKNVSWLTMECGKSGAVLKRVSVRNATRRIRDVVSTVMKSKNLVVNVIRTKHGNHFIDGRVQVMDMEQILRTYQNELVLKVWYELRKDSRVCTEQHKNNKFVAIICRMWSFGFSTDGKMTVY